MTMGLSNFREVDDKKIEENTKQQNQSFKEMAVKLERPKNEKEFIDKVISNWDSAYARKYEQKELLRSLLDRLEKLEQLYSSLVSRVSFEQDTSKFNLEDKADTSSSVSASCSSGDKE